MEMDWHWLVLLTVSLALAEFLVFLRLSINNCITACLVALTKCLIFVIRSKNVSHEQIILEIVEFQVVKLPQLSID